MRPDHPKALKVIRVVANEFDVPADTLAGRAVRLRYTTPRHVAMAVLRRWLGWSYESIGKAFNRDHSSVIYGINRADPEMVERLYNRVKACDATQTEG